MSEPTPWRTGETPVGGDMVTYTVRPTLWGRFLIALGLRKPVVQGYVCSVTFGGMATGSVEPSKVTLTATHPGPDA